MNKLIFATVAVFLLAYFAPRLIVRGIVHEYSHQRDLYEAVNPLEAEISRRVRASKYAEKAKRLIEAVEK